MTTHTPHPLRHVRGGFLEPLPNGVKLVARNSRYGNPFRVERVGPKPTDWRVVYQVNRHIPQRLVADGLTALEAQTEAVDQFREWLENTTRGRETLTLAREELKGKRLACYCPLDKVCHADVLAEMVNGDTTPAHAGTPIREREAAG